MLDDPGITFGQRRVEFGDEPGDLLTHSGYEGGLLGSVLGPLLHDSRCSLSQVHALDRSVKA